MIPTMDRPYPNAVELIPTLEALFPRGGPVQDTVLTPTLQSGTGVPRS